MFSVTTLANIICVSHIKIYINKADTVTVFEITTVNMYVNYLISYEKLGRYQNNRMKYVFFSSLYSFVVDKFLHINYSNRI